MILDSETNRLVQVGWRYSKEVNGELCVETGGGTTTRVLRTFAGRWVTLGEAGGPEEKNQLISSFFGQIFGKLS